MSAKRPALLLAKLCFCVISAAVVYLQPAFVFANTGSSSAGPDVACPLGCITVNARCLCP